MTDDTASSNGQVTEECGFETDSGEACTLLLDHSGDCQHIPSTLPDTDHYQHSLDWRGESGTTISSFGTLDLTGEPIEVQAAMRVLEGMQTSLFLDWTIHHPERRLAAARQMARIHRDIEKVLTSNDFNPV